MEHRTRAYAERIWNPTKIDTQNTGVNFQKVSQTYSPVLALSGSVGTSPIQTKAFIIYDNKVTCKNLFRRRQR